MDPRGRNGLIPPGANDDQNVPAARDVNGGPQHRQYGQDEQATYDPRQRPGAEAVARGQGLPQDQRAAQQPRQPAFDRAHGNAHDPIPLQGIQQDDSLAPMMRRARADFKNQPGDQPVQNTPPPLAVSRLPVQPIVHATTPGHQHDAAAPAPPAAPSHSKHAIPTPTDPALHPNQINGDPNHARRPSDAALHQPAAHVDPAVQHHGHVDAAHVTPPVTTVAPVAPDAHHAHKEVKSVEAGSKKSPHDPKADEPATKPEHHEVKIVHEHHDRVEDKAKDGKNAAPHDGKHELDEHHSHRAKDTKDVKDHQPAVVVVPAPAAPAHADGKEDAREEEKRLRALKAAEDDKKTGEERVAHEELRRERKNNDRERRKAEFEAEREAQRVRELAHGRNGAFLARQGVHPLMPAGMHPAMQMAALQGRPFGRPGMPYGPGPLPVGRGPLPYGRGPMQPGGFGGPPFPGQGMPGFGAPMGMGGGGFPVGGMPMGFAGAGPGGYMPGGGFGG
jgi:hypothetical protein